MCPRRGPSGRLDRVSAVDAAMVLELVSPCSVRAGRALWSCTDDVGSRYYGRPATAEGIEAPSGTTRART